MICPCEKQPFISTSCLPVAQAAMFHCKVYFMIGTILVRALTVTDQLEVFCVFFNVLFMLSSLSLLR